MPANPFQKNLTKGETLAKVALLCNQLNLRFFHHFLLPDISKYRPKTPH
jgi:hypothetical protein